MSEDKRQAVSPLRQRMIEDMRIRKLERKTQEMYIRGVCRLAKYLGRSPQTATAEDLRRFQLHLVEAGVSPITLNATLTAVKFLFQITLDRPHVVSKLRRVRVEQKLPVVLSREEVALLIESAANLKMKTALTLAYGAGLRAGEVVALKTVDVDSQRMVLRIEQAKGRKDRYAILSPLMLERLRAWWRYGKSQNMVIDGGWLFPGMDRVSPMQTRQLNRGVHDAARAAGLDKRVSMHTLRHCFATHLLEQKEDIRVVQVLLGHKKIDTTTVYTHVATEVLREVVPRTMRSRSAIGSAFPKDDIRNLAKATPVRAPRYRRRRHRLQHRLPRSNLHSTTPLLTAVSTPAVSSLGGCPTPATHTAATQAAYTCTGGNPAILTRSG